MVCIIKVFRWLVGHGSKDPRLKRLVLRREVEVPKGLDPAEVADLVVTEAVGIVNEIGDIPGGATLHIVASNTGKDSDPGIIAARIETQGMLDQHILDHVGVVEIREDSSSAPQAEVIFNLPSVDEREL